MGTNGKAIAAFGMLMLEAPQHAFVLLSALVQSMPNFPLYSPMVQDGLMFFLAKLPVAAAAAGVVWWVKNHPAAVPDPEPPRVPLTRSSILGAKEII